MTVLTPLAVAYGIASTLHCKPTKMVQIDFCVCDFQATFMVWLRLVWFLGLCKVQFFHVWQHLLFHGIQLNSVENCVQSATLAYRYIKLASQIAIWIVRRKINSFGLLFTRSMRRQVVLWPVYSLEYWCIIPADGMSFFIFLRAYWQFGGFYSWVWTPIWSKFVG